MAPYQEILLEAAGGVATITLNRPGKLNAWTTVMEREVRHAMVAADLDDSVRVIVLTGAGRGFCAGADLSVLHSVIAGKPPEPGDDSTAPREGVRSDFQKRYTYFPAIGKPLIAAVNGPAVGLGFILALYCDLRIAAASARFGTAFARRGLIAEYGLAWLLPRITGLANALDLLLTARIVDSSEALRMGLVNRVLPEESFREGMRELALELATSVSPRSLRVIKRQVYESQFQTLAEAVALANTEMARSFDTEDFREGVAHFLEKRAPSFTGR
ncbi:MAG: enoyl-CoA hydratase [Acidobacteria bacterium]|nr:enoyl-CoA hydratase [Acidobacteriota bacterium]